MENKEDLVNKLLKEGRIDFKEACVLMDMKSNQDIEVKKWEPKQAAPYSYRYGVDPFWGSPTDPK